VPSNTTLAKKIKKIQYDQETKYHNENISTTADSLGTLTVLNIIPQGTDQQSRIGNEIRMTSIQCRYTLNNLAVTTGEVRVTWRVIMFYDRQANGALCNLFATAITTPALLDASSVTNLTLSPYQAESRERFKVLYDKSGVISDDTANSQWMTISHKTLLKKLSGTGVADLNSNAIYIACMLGDANIDPSTVVNWQAGNRIYFKD